VVVPINTVSQNEQSENAALHPCAVRFLWRGQPMEFSCAPEPWFLEFASTG